MQTRPPLLEDVAVTLTIPVHWGDQDSFRHVNNTVYLRWCETARIEYLTRIGLWQARPGEGVGPILASISCDYRLALTYPDQVVVGARVISIGNSSFRMVHRVVSLGKNALAAESDSTIVVLDYARQKSITVPKAVRQAIEELEGQSFPTPVNGTRG
jgi:acyl-CoA thioester hydrolase